MKTSEIRELSTKELQERVDAEKSMMTKLTINHAVTPLENPMKIRHTRRDIARMATELSMRELSDIKK